MDEVNRLSGRVAERDLQLGKLLCAKIDGLPDQGFTQRQSIYAQARASLEKQISHRHAAGLPADRAALRQSVENAIQLVEEHYGSESSRLAPQKASTDPGTTAAPSGPSAHGFRPATAALIATVFASLLFPTTRLPTALLGDEEPVGGRDADRAPEAAHGGDRLPERVPPSVVASRPAPAGPAKPPETIGKDDRLPSSLGPDLPPPKAERTASTGDAAPLSNPKAVPARPGPPPVSQEAVSTTFDSRFSPKPAPSSAEAPLDSIPGVPGFDEAPSIWSDVKEAKADDTPRAPTGLSPNALGGKLQEPKPASRNAQITAWAAPTVAAEETPPVQDELSGKNIDDKAVGSITSYAVDPSRDDNSPADAPPQAVLPQQQPSEESEEQLSALRTDSRHGTAQASLRLEDGSEMAPSGPSVDEPLPWFKNEIIVTASGSPEKSVVWETTLQQFPGKAAPEEIVQATVRMDGRRLATVFMRRNADSIVPASHIIELVFEADARIEGSKVQSIGPASLRDWPDSKGEELAAFPFEISPGHFVMTLSPNAESETRNVQLLTQRPWVSIPLTLANGVNRFLVLQKGDIGAKAFESALARRPNDASQTGRVE